ncbi:protein NYNRIN-like [Rhodamnia argentea]|uniref:Protein NYNRIN-like n=1 Tax=Rhodamnia argentea TaxID=178133 RepID=A0ABM3HPQ4_9MYRT|nr:protein NYNRIN-like [Rhodamnia argentea]
MSLMDGHSGYNRIFIAAKDVHKTAFRCPEAIGTFKWVVMPFGLKNADATYQRAMNYIFHDMIGEFMEVYIDDVIVKTNQWVEAASYKNVTQKTVREFIKEWIIHRFGIPETITANQGTVFTRQEILDFAKSKGIKMIHSMPYYAQANGQAEASKKIIIGLIKRHLEDNPKEWDSLLSTMLWAYRTSTRSSTGVTPYMLTYGQEAVLPLEITVQSLKVKLQDGMAKEQYDEMMYANIDELGENRATKTEKFIAQKRRVGKVYNKHVRAKHFNVGDLVWKTILPMSLDSEKFGKWSSKWE